MLQKKLLNPMKKHFQIDKVDFKVILTIFLISKVLIISTIFLASQIIPPENFPYKDLLSKFYLPHLWMSHANFDGIQYITIAREGYYNFNQAFFPLYPLILRFLAPVFNYNYVYEGIIISNLFFISAIYFFSKLLRELKIKESNIFWSALFLVFFPTSFFFGAIYPTSFFFLLIIIFFYSFIKLKSIGILLTGILAGITVINGILLSASSLGSLIVKRKINRQFILGILSPVIGLGIYSYYLYKTTSDPLYYFHSQVAFGANRSTELVLLPQVIYRYIKIFITSSFNFQLFIAYLEFIMFSFAFILTLYYLYFVYREKIKDKSTHWLIGLFSIGNLLISPLTGTFTSTPRYVLYSLSIFIIMPFVVKRKITRCVIIILFGILQIILLSYFSQGYFVS